MFPVSIVFYYAGTKNASRVLRLYQPWLVGRCLDAGRLAGAEWAQHITDVVAESTTADDAGAPGIEPPGAEEQQQGWEQQHKQLI